MAHWHNYWQQRKARWQTQWQGVVATIATMAMIATTKTRSGASFPPTLDSVSVCSSTSTTSGGSKCSSRLSFLAAAARDKDDDDKGSNDVAITSTSTSNQRRAIAQLALIFIQDKLLEKYHERSFL
mmetsp:Transcript_11221/g.23711  ORF Transcript_11221/g.23711 Transcript_11221/m.23711 type:complete len:126 (+) Transcript_11221:455-832(+)